MPKRISIKDQLTNYTVNADGCWEWVKTTDGDGYGVLWSCGKRMRAHRASYEFHVGPVPAGLWILHHCDNRVCINPDHLYAGTTQDNTNDMVRRGRQPRGGRHGSSKLTEADVHAIRADTRILRKVAADYDISKGQVSGIKTRRYWAHV